MEWWSIGVMDFYIVSVVDFLSALLMGIFEHFHDDLWIYGVME